MILAREDAGAAFLEEAQCSLAGQKQCDNASLGVLASADLQRYRRLQHPGRGAHSLRFARRAGCCYIRNGIGASALEQTAGRRRCKADEV